MQARQRQQIVDVGHASGQRILDRDHRQIGIAVFERHEGILEGRAGQRFHRRKHVAAGHVGIGAEIALEGNLVGDGRHGLILVWQREWHAPFRDRRVCRRRAAPS
ncbi:hypothetical protein D3C87_1818640 [compost metagenome]